MFPWVEVGEMFCASISLELVLLGLGLLGCLERAMEGKYFGLFMGRFISYFFFFLFPFFLLKN